MKLTIDTKEDSHDDIRKVIKMLQHLVGSDSYSNYDSESSSRNIFDDPSPSLSPSEQMDVSDEQESTVSEEAQSAAPTNAFSAMFGGNEPKPTYSDDNAEEATPYGNESNEEEKKLDLDKEMIPY